MTYQANELPVAAPTITLRRSLAAATIAVTAGLLAPACADNESSLFIRDCIPPIFQQQSGCVVPEPNDATFFIASGTHDAALGSEYGCWLRVGNQVVQQGSSDQIRTETSRINLYAADVRLTDLAGNALTYTDGSAVEFSVPISGFVDPGDGSDGEAGYGYANVLMIDQATSEALAGQIVGGGGEMDVLAGIIVYGRTLGGQELETPEWFFQIRVCVACACVQSGASYDPTVMSGGGTGSDFACTADLGAVPCTQYGVLGADTCSDVRSAFGVGP